MDAREDLYSIFITSCQEQIHAMETGILDLEKAPPEKRTDIVAAIFRGAHSIKGDADTIGLKRISDLSHKTENILEKLRDGRLAVSPELINTILKSIDRLKHMIQTCRTEQPKPGDNLMTWLDQPAAEEGKAAKEPRNHADAQTIQRISIAAERLDNLLAPVGELATLQIRLNQLAGEAANEPMIAMAREIERISEVLRKQILDMRMLELDTLVSKYRRLIRDLSHQLGKNCGFRVSGERISLDKGILEKLNLALIHILRNALDHGIEPPSRRLECGKPAQGLIDFTARQTGSEVEITIRDDGAGIDTLRLEKIARDRGQLPPGQSLTPQESLT